MKNGTLMRQVVNKINGIDFNATDDRHMFGDIYEKLLKDLQSAGNAGEFYTPRAVTQFIVEQVNPRLGETICDPAVGSAGFLCESFDYLRAQNPQRTTAQDRTLQERTFYGKEKKSLAYVIAIMNMILHGIEAPNIMHTNTLAENLADIQERDRVDVVLAAPLSRDRLRTRKSSDVISPNTGGVRCVPEPTATCCPGST